MNVFIMGESGGIDFHNRSENHEMPVRSCSRNIVNEVNIKPFIYNAEKSKAGMRDVLLVGRIFCGFSCFTKMLFIYTAGKGMYIIMLVFLEFKNALSTC